MKNNTIRLGLVGAVLLACAPWLLAAEDTNKEILKQAIQGAITGAVASGDKDTAKAVEEAATDKAKDKVKDKSKKNNFVKKKKKRPYGWDQGKKTGWGEGDEPPGLAKK